MKKKIKILWIFQGLEWPMEAHRRNEPTCVPRAAIPEIPLHTPGLGKGWGGLHPCSQKKLEIAAALLIHHRSPDFPAPDPRCVFFLTILPFSR